MALSARRRIATESRRLDKRLPGFRLPEGIVALTDGVIRRAILFPRRITVEDQVLAQFDDFRQVAAAPEGVEPGAADEPIRGPLEVAPPLFNTPNLSHRF